MDTKEIVKEINESIPQARSTIESLSDDGIIELRAELEASKIHFGKWMNSFMVFLTVLIAILALNSDLTNWCVIVILLFIDVAVLVVHCVVEIKNANKVRALSILNDCCRRRERPQDIETSDDIAIERYEDLEQRQRNERQTMLREWQRVQYDVNRQVRSFEESLSVVEEDR